MACQEILRFFGGPAIGDLRSSLVRLSDSQSEEGHAVKALLMHRIGTCLEEAQADFMSLVNDSSPMWQGISPEYRCTIRTFLVYFHSQMLSRTRHPDFTFDFCCGSVGNMVLTGCRMFFQSLSAAIFMFSRMALIPSTTEVLPCVDVNHSVVLRATLQNGAVITGQPKSNVVDKEVWQPLESPIQRVDYVVQPPLYQKAESRLFDSKVRMFVYSMGSLYTSIIPTLRLFGDFSSRPDMGACTHCMSTSHSTGAPLSALEESACSTALPLPEAPNQIVASLCKLRTVGHAIASNQASRKVLLLNGSHDRETASASSSDLGPSGIDLSAAGFIKAITDALNLYSCSSSAPGSISS
eukprot:gene8399-1501_t